MDLNDFGHHVPIIKTGRQNAPVCPFKLMGKAINFAGLGRTSASGGNRNSSTIQTPAPSKTVCVSLLTGSRLPPIE